MASREFSASEKDDARSKTWAAIEKGILVRASACERCGSTYRIEGHHIDYHDPLAILWLCKRCHVREHYPAATFAKSSAPSRQIPTSTYRLSGEGLAQLAGLARRLGISRTAVLERLIRQKAKAFERSKKNPEEGMQ